MALLQNCLHLRAENLTAERREIMTDQQKEKLRKGYETALLSQGACNLSGLVHSLAEAVELNWQEATEQGQRTDYVNIHPIVRLCVEQMSFLCRADYSASYKTCLERSKKNKERRKEYVERSLRRKAQKDPPAV